MKSGECLCCAPPVGVPGDPTSNPGHLDSSSAPRESTHPPGSNSADTGNGKRRLSETPSILLVVPSSIHAAQTSRVPGSEIPRCAHTHTRGPRRSGVAVPPKGLASPRRGNPLGSEDAAVPSRPPARSGDPNLAPRPLGRRLSPDRPGTGGAERCGRAAGKRGRPTRGKGNEPRSRARRRRVSPPAPDLRLRSSGRGNHLAGRTVTGEPPGPPPLAGAGTRRGPGRGGLSGG